MRIIIIAKGIHNIMNKNYYKYLNYAKGVGAILVIWGHMTTYPRVIRSAIYSFHMPLFFIITGILFSVRPNESKFKDYFIKKVNSILLPSVILEMIMFAWLIAKNMIELEYTHIQLFKHFLGIFLQIGYSDYSGSLWFLFSYFIAVLLVFFVFYIDEKYYLLMAIGCIGASYTLAKLIPTLYLPWHLEIIPACIGYIIIGICVGNYIEFFFSSKGKMILTLFLCFLGWTFCAFKVELHYALDSHDFGNIFIDTCMAVLGSLFVIVSCKLYEETCKNNMFERWISFVGKNSLYFYGIQAIMVGVLNTIIRLFIDEPSLYSILGVGISLLSLLISLVVDSLLIFWLKPVIVIAQEKCKIDMLC